MTKKLSTVTVARVAGLAAALVGAIAAQGQPTGTQWDCILSGKGQQGIAFITFHDDGTFSGYELLSTQAIGSPKNDDRGPYTDMGRDPGSASSTNVVYSVTNLFGFGPIEGPWRYDSKGRVAGHFVQYIGRDEEGVARYTNAVSFSAKVVPGKRLTMVASTRNGRLTYSGVPYGGTPDFRGAWSGNKVAGRRGQTFLEFFDLNSFADENPFGEWYPDLADYPGIYFTPVGEGAGYNTAGFTMVSSRKKIAFAFESTPWGDTNSVLSATFGTWSTKKGVLNATTKGYEESGSTVTFKARMTPVE